jgi:hypothetical protein
VKKSLKYLVYTVVLLSVLLAVGWFVFPEKTTNTYALLIRNLGLKRQELDEATCHEDTCYALHLNDNVLEYLEESYLNGTQTFLKTTNDIRKLYRKGKLLYIENSDYYVVDTMYYSYSFLVPEAKILLDTIGERFHRKLENTSLECSRFTLTSMLRTTNSIKRLRRWNRNSIKNSAHLHGTTFDISYRTFFSTKELSPAESAYLADVLGKVIFELRREQKCYATYETWQTCYHVVSR